MMNLASCEQVFIAQSFDLLNWERLRRLVSNADMPAIGIDIATGRVLLAYEHFLSSKAKWPCAIGVRVYKSIDTLISGRPVGTFTAPNTISRIEGTPNIYRFDPLAGVVELGFHYQNETLLRDQVARATLLHFPGKASWEAAPDAKYNAMMTRAGVTGNIGGREQVRFGHQTFVVCEGNIQHLPAHPTNWSTWRVWLWQNDSLAMLPVHTHKGSVSIANPSAIVVPSPASNKKALLISYFIFGEGAAKGEGGSFLSYTEI
jgi:hypothetical protein